MSSTTPGIFFPRTSAVFGSQQLAFLRAQGESVEEGQTAIERNTCHQPQWDNSESPSKKVKEAETCRDITGEQESDNRSSTSERSWVLEHMLKTIEDTTKESLNRGNDQRESISFSSDGWFDFVSTEICDEIQRELTVAQQQCQHINAKLVEQISKLHLQAQNQSGLEISLDVGLLKGGVYAEQSVRNMAQSYVRQQILDYAEAEILRLEEKQILESVLGIVQYLPSSIRFPMGSVVLILEGGLQAGLCELDRRLFVCGSAAAEEILEQQQVVRYHPELKELSQTTEMCHYCQRIMPEDLLVKCRYKSRRCVPEILQKGDRLLVEQYASQRCRGPLSVKEFLRAYVDVNAYRSNKLTARNHYQCDRWFCGDCLVELRESGLYNAKSELCAYCQGVCDCRRCLRNDAILKLATVHFSYGGNIQRLRYNSGFAKYRYEADM